MQGFIRHVFFRAAYILHQLVNRSEQARNGSLPILCFHRVHPHYDPLTQPLHPRELERMLKILMRHWKFYKLDELSSAMDNPQGCILTFDDGLQDFYDFAWPVIQKLGIPTTMFVPTASVDRGEPLYNYKLAEMLLFGKGPIHVGAKSYIPGQPNMKEYLELVGFVAKNPAGGLSMIEKYLRQWPLPGHLAVSPMSWDQIKDLEESGVSIGYHSHHHFWMPAMSSEALEHDVIKNEKSLANHQKIETPFFAFPMGGYDDRLVELLDHRGWVGLTTGEQMAGKEEKVLARYNVSDRSGEELHLRLLGFHHRIKTLLR